MKSPLPPMLSSPLSTFFRAFSSPHFPIYLLLTLTLSLSTSRAADYQFSIPIPQAPQSSRAWLWIPPQCHRVRGILLGGQVILEKLVLDDPLIRAAAAKEDLAILILCPNPLGEFHYNEGAATLLQQILADLAAESGYDEIASAPLLPIGHSGGAITAWNIAYWNPARTIALVSLHAAAILPPPWDKKATADGIPVLAISGQYESWGNPAEPLDKHWRWLRGGLLNMRAAFNESLVSELVQPGAGHFSWDQPLAQHVALFIQKSAHARIPRQPGAAPLLHLPLTSGYLTDITLLTPSNHPPAPYSQYTGDPSLAFWHIDEQLARAAESFCDSRKSKLDQRVTFLENGKPLPASWITPLQFQPLEDGLTIKVAATFLDKTPQGVANPDQPLSHAPGPIQFRLIGGWGGGGQQLSPDTFQIRFDHFGINRRTANLQIIAYHPGDARYAYAEQAAQISFPEKLTAGKPQTITFPRIPDLPANTPDLQLTATSDSNLPVHYFIRQGPAEINGTTLHFTPIPPRSNYPIKVTITAYQPGLSPSLQSAPPIEQTFQLQKPPSSY